MNTTQQVKPQDFISFSLIIPHLTPASARKLDLYRNNFTPVDIKHTPGNWNAYLAPPTGQGMN